MPVPFVLSDIMLRRILYVLSGLLALFMLLFAIVAAVVYANGDEIKRTLIREVSSATGAKVAIHGNIKFALFRHLPNLALQMQGVEVKGSDSTAIPFLKAERVFLLANFWDVIRSNWNIKTTSIENGEVTMLRNKQGAVNYRFETGDSAAPSSASFKIGIDKALLENIRFRLLDEIADVSIYIQADDVSVRGDFSAENLSLKATGNVFSHSIKIKQVDYGQGKQISFDGFLAVQPEKESYLLAIERFIVENNVFVINGSIVMEDNIPVFDLGIRGKNISIRDLPMLLPAAFARKYKELKGTGSINLNSEIKGRLDAEHNPFITITASTTGATLHIPGMKSKLESLSFSGSFTNGKKHALSTSILAINHLTAKSKQGVLDGDFTLTDFENPTLILNASGVADLAILNGIISDSSRLKTISGTAEFASLKYAGRVSDLAAGRFAGIEGSVAMKNILLKLDTMIVSLPEALVHSQGNTLSLHKLHMQLPGCSFSATGAIMQMPRFSDNSAIPTVDLTVKAEKIDIPNILKLVNGSGPSFSSDEKSVSESFGLNGFIRLTSGYIGWNNFKAYDASCTLMLNRNMAEIKDFSCNTMDGTLDIESKIELQSGKVSTVTRAHGSSISITELFYQLDNFNQQTLTAKNVAGKLEFTANVDADFVKGELNEQSLTASADIVITEGQLIDFKPLERLSKFIDIEELRNIRFSTMKNTVSIAARTVHIPEMLVKSTALNLSVSGKQTFDDVIDYHVKVNIFDVLGKKFRKRRKTISDYEEVAENNFNFYLSMTGTPDNPVIRHEKLSFKDRLSQQKNDFQLLKKNQDNEKTAAQDGIKEKTIFNNNKRQKQDDEEELEFIEWEDEGNEQQ